MHNQMSTAAYWTARNAELAAATADDAAYATSYAGRLEAAQRRLNLVTGDAAAYTDADRAAALAALDALAAEADAQFAAEWTRAVTIARRVEWNAAVARIGREPKARQPRLIHEQQQRQGWSVESLRRAIALHQL